MRVLFAASEVFPLAKTGGLADVIAGLSLALAQLGVDVRLLVPGYTEALDRAEAKRDEVVLQGIPCVDDVTLVAARMPDTGLPVWLVDCPSLFRRAGGPYVDPEGRDWPDNAIRFATLSHVAARIAVRAAGTAWRPDLVHAHDWHLGLLPALLAEWDGAHPPVILTIHNVAFQGVFPQAVFSQLGLPAAAFTPESVEYYGNVSFLKAGIRHADRVTTVSRTYAREILTPEFGCGLDGVLRSRADGILGILNGADYENWNPEDSATLAAAYNARDLTGKKTCKAALQEEFDLPLNAERPLIAFASRMTEQKMADLLPSIAPLIVERGAQLVACGEGDHNIEDAVRAAADRDRKHISVRIGYDEGVARRLLAGADIVLAPARFEPCGLVQLYAMRYGALPIVRRTGGLADTVVAFAETDVASTDAATGFAFERPTLPDLACAIECACRTYRDHRTWSEMQNRAMNQDFAWRRPAQQYLSLYCEIVGRACGGLPRKQGIEVSDANRSRAGRLVQ